MSILSTLVLYQCMFPMQNPEKETKIRPQYGYNIKKAIPF